MKVIFLDFDGVLNHEAFYKQRLNDPNFSADNYPITEFDPNCIEILNYICATTDAKVVISSSWRHGRTVEQLRDLLYSVGFIYPMRIISKTPTLTDDDCVRGNEIEKWMKLNRELIGKYFTEYDEYVILDDDNDMLYTQKDNFLHVDRFVGITFGTAEKAVKILNR